jgi:hypothetical protein
VIAAGAGAQRGPASRFLNRILREHQASRLTALRDAQLTLNVRHGDAQLAAERPLRDAQLDAERPYGTRSSTLMLPRVARE